MERTKRSCERPLDEEGVGRMVVARDEVGETREVGEGAVIMVVVPTLEGCLLCDEGGVGGDASFASAGLVGSGLVGAGEGGVGVVVRGVREVSPLKMGLTFRVPLTGVGNGDEYGTAGWDGKWAGRADGVGRDAGVVVVE